MVIVKAETSTSANRFSIWFGPRIPMACQPERCVTVWLRRHGWSSLNLLSIFIPSLIMYRQVPDSSIVADVAETQNSGITGLNPTVTAQLLRSNISDVEV
jgi:hypothetical protein